MADELSQPDAGAPLKTSIRTRGDDDACLAVWRIDPALLSVQMYTAPCRLNTHSHHPRRRG